MDNKFQDLPIANQLNEQQRLPVFHKSGPMLVIAGAGSGKTRVITARIVRLIIEEHVGAHALVALTFTNKAAQEMKERIRACLPQTEGIPFIGTFHSYCIRLLRSVYAEQEYQFSVLDEDDQRAMITNIIKHYGAQKMVTPRAALSYISSCKNNMALVADVSRAHDALMNDIMRAYEYEKKMSRAFDFDDLLIETLALFKNNPSFALQHQQRVRHLLIDEYQDTNHIQHQLLKYMALSGHQFAIDSLCAVGDEDQSIYSWRGAIIDNILNFSSEFVGAQVFKIDQNYRSASSILSVANTLIAHNTERHAKSLWSTRTATDRVRVVACSSEHQEAHLIISGIKLLRQVKKQATAAILYRTHAQSRVIEEACVKAAIPYKMVGGVQFYERKEVKDIIAYLRLINNKYDRPSFYRIYNTPARGLGEKIEELFRTYWNQYSLLSCTELIDVLVASDLIARKSQKDVLLQFKSIIDNAPRGQSVGEIIEYVIAAIGYYSYLTNEYDGQEAIDRIENVKELLGAVAHMQEEQGAPITLDHFLQEVSLMQELVYKHDKNQEFLVSLMTIHAAKGLEFDMVFLAGFEGGILPSMRNYTVANGIEEDRRLVYVAFTRAREYLLVSYARSRYLYGSLSEQRPSRFLDELCSKNTTQINSVDWSAMDFNNFYIQWFEGKPYSAHGMRVAHQFNSGMRSSSPAIKHLDTSKKDIRHQVGKNVEHKVYGTGLIIGVEERTAELTILTIRFQAGIKRISSAFVT